MKPNTKFELSVKDIEIIETALRNKAGRRGQALWNNPENSEKLKSEADEILDLLGRLHHQKVWYRPTNKTYVGG
jgi:hypothetical protein